MSPMALAIVIDIDPSEGWLFGGEVGRGEKGGEIKFAKVLWEGEWNNARLADLLA